MTCPSKHRGPSVPSRPAERGFALIAVMWVVLVAGLMLMGVHKAVQANLSMARNELESVRAHWLARAGVEQAVAILEDDGKAVDGMWDLWYSDQDSFEKVPLLGGRFSVIGPAHPFGDPRKSRYGLTDHCGRVNVNTADENQLKLLCDLRPWQVSSILDWRDGDNDARPGGAEAVHYHRLDYPYLIRNGALKTLDELRLVHGIEEQVFTGEDANLNGVLDANEDDTRTSLPDDDGDGKLARGLGGLMTVYSYELNRDADGRQRVNVNSGNTSDLRTALVDRFNFTDALARGVSDHSSGGRGGSNRFNSLMDLVSVRPAQGRSGQDSSDDKDKVKEITVKWLAKYLDELTLTDDERLPGRINVNTAPEEVLATLPKMSAATVEAIVRRQSGSAGPFDSVGELLTGEVLTEEQFKAVAERLSVRSSVFGIRSVGVSRWGIRREIVAVVDRGAQSTTILYWCQSE